MTDECRCGECMPPDGLAHRVSRVAQILWASRPMSAEWTYDQCVQVALDIALIETGRDE